MSANSIPDLLTFSLPLYFFTNLQIVKRKQMKLLYESNVTGVPQ